jgi:hypothetical protein
MQTRWMGIVPVLSLVLLGGCDTRPVVLPTDQTACPFRVVMFQSCHDGDTCTVSLADLPPLFGNHISVRILGIDTPMAHVSVNGP